MAVAKKQRREKPMKIEQRKVRGPEWEPQVKQTALLASPVYIGQAQGEEKKTHKKRSQNWTGGISSLCIFWVGQPSHLEDIFSFACQIKLNCNCLFNIYAEYIMRNSGLEEAQAGIKISGRNINNLRYADDTTLMAESEEELKSLWWKWKRRVKKLA